MRSSSKGLRVMVVDDSAATLEVLQRNLIAEGYQVVTATGVIEAIRMLKQVDVDLLITDLKMPRISGLDLVRHVRDNLKGTQVMMITGYPSITGAVEAVKSGAEEYLAKPFTDAELLSAVRRALDKLRLRRCALASEQPSDARPRGIIGQSRVMQDVVRAIGKASSTSATVLITGESGTGKELVARAIHYNGSRAGSPFVPVNCGAIPEGLIESELFGHVKGAFTGATTSRAGLFHAADGGTVFLDEISEMPLPLQVRLLRVLEDKEVWMVGANRSRKTDVRILAASNLDLAGLVKSGVFREDLFYRLNVITISVPPLRERGDDILLLARHYAARFSLELGKPPPEFTDGVLGSLSRHHWPGNVRELRNVVQRLIVMSDGDVIDVPDLPEVMRFSVPRNTRLHRSLAEVEGEHIFNVLAGVHSNKSRAAQILGIDRKTLREKLKNLRPPPS